MNIFMENIIYECITGSTCYGINTETSDIDKKAVCIFPLEHILSLDKKTETLSLHPKDFNNKILKCLNLSEPTDYEIHSLKKFMLLCKKCNPTILEMLFVDKKFVTIESKYSKILRENRNIFLSQKCINTFGGYAMQQLIRIKNALVVKNTSLEVLQHLNDTLNRMIITFNEKYGDYGLKITLENEIIYISMNGKMPLDTYLGMLSEINNCKNINYKKNNSQNRKRDAENINKHNAHLIRLLQCGIELCETGTLSVFRPNREELMQIRKGEIPQDEIFKYAEELNKKFMGYVNDNALPKKSNNEEINQLYRELMLMYIKEKENMLC